jgi:hypothetical protein
MSAKVDQVYKKDAYADKMDQFPAELRSKYTAAINSASEITTIIISTFETALNTAKTKHIGYIQEMTSEYMGALSKFANYKGKKND